MLGRVPRICLVPDITSLATESRPTWEERVHEVATPVSSKALVKAQLSFLHSELIQTMACSRTSTADQAKALHLIHLYEAALEHSTV